MTLICSICQKPNLNPISFVTDGFYIIVPDSWLKFCYKNYGVSVSVCLYVST